MSRQSVKWIKPTPATVPQPTRFGTLHTTEHIVHMVRGWLTNSNGCESWHGDIYTLIHSSESEVLRYLSFKTIIVVGIEHPWTHVHMQCKIQIVDCS